MVGYIFLLVASFLRLSWKQTLRLWYLCADWSERALGNNTCCRGGVGEAGFGRRKGWALMLHNSCPSWSSGELWSWDDTSELSQLRWGGQAFVVLHQSVIGCRLPSGRRHNLAEGESLLQRAVPRDGQHCEPSAAGIPRSWGTDVTRRRSVKIWVERTAYPLDCSDSLAF